MLALLLDLGSDIAVVADSGSLETPLHVAARAGHLDLVQKLISCGANAYGKTKDGSTPLHYAAAFGQAYIVDELVKVRPCTLKHSAIRSLLMQRTYQGTPGDLLLMFTTGRK